MLLPKIGINLPLWFVYLTSYDQYSYKNINIGLHNIKQWEIIMLDFNVSINDYLFIIHAMNVENDNAGKKKKHTQTIEFSL